MAARRSFWGWGNEGAGLARRGRPRQAVGSVMLASLLIAALFFLYLSAAVMILGGEINRAIRELRERSME